MATYVLIHGSFLGKWCWRDIVPALENKGHRCIAFDLPGHGEDSTPPRQVSMEDYVDALTRVMAPLDENPILVGHSMGAAIVALAAENQPDRVEALVYVAGIVVPGGRSIFETVGGGFDPDYLAQIVWSDDRRTGTLSAKGAREFAFSRCPPAMVEEIIPLLRAEPVAPLESPIRTTSRNFGRVPGYYVECTADRLIPLTLQRVMYSEVPCNRVFSIETDHCPFLSAPDKLAAFLIEVAEESANR